MTTTSKLISNKSLVSLAIHTSVSPLKLANQKRSAIQNIYMEPSVKIEGDSDTQNTRVEEVRRKLTKSYSDPELKLVMNTEKTNHRKVQSSLHGIDESVEVKTRKLVIKNTKITQINLPRAVNETPVVN